MDDSGRVCLASFIAAASALLIGFCVWGLFGVQLSRLYALCCFALTLAGSLAWLWFHFFQRGR